MMMIFVKFSQNLKNKLIFVFSLGQIFIFALCIVRQVAPSGYLQNTFSCPGVN